MNASANDCDASLVQSSESEFELDTEIESGRSTLHRTLVPEAKTNRNEYIWRRMDAADIDALYTDAAYPNPFYGANCRANKSILNAIFWQMHSHFQIIEQEIKQFL